MAIEGVADAVLLSSKTHENVCDDEPFELNSNKNNNIHVSLCDTFLRRG